MKLKNIILILLVVALLGIGVVKEPVSDSFDMITGASTDTYSTQIDLIAGASDGYGSGSGYSD